MVIVTVVAVVTSAVMPRSLNAVRISSAVVAAFAPIISAVKSLPLLVIIITLSFVA